MKKIIKGAKGILCGFAVLFSSCDTWLDVKPIDVIDEKDVFSSTSSYYYALNGIYLGLANTELYGEHLSAGFVDVLAQTYLFSEVHKDHPYYYTSLYEYTESKVEKRISEMWGKAYEMISNCNYLLRKVESDRQVLSRTDRAYLKGEALALRAYLHFDMFRLFGPIYTDENKEVVCIPYYTEFSIQETPLLKAGEVVDRILKDIDDALEELKEDIVLTNGKQASYLTSNVYANRHLRMNYYAVKALKARVLLYCQDKDGAYKIASELLKNSHFAGEFPFITGDVIQKVENPDRFFYTEQLFCIQKLSRNDLYSVYFDPLLGDSQYMCADRPRVLALFSASDKDYRLKAMWGLAPVGGKGISFRKYEPINDNDGIRNTVMGMIRLSELYLIMAETAPTQSEQLFYLNTLRINRGYHSNSVTAADNIPNVIRNEYMREFYGEGQYFYYLKRNNIKSIPNGNSQSNDITMGEDKYVIPLPAEEIKYRQ